MRAAARKKKAYKEESDDDDYDDESDFSEDDDDKPLKVLVAASTAVRKRAADDKKNKKKKSKKPKSRGSDAADGDEMQIVQEVAPDGGPACPPERQGEYRKPNGGNAALLEEKKEIAAKSTVEPEPVAPDDKPLQLSAPDRSRRSLYLPPSLGRVMYESEAANPIARKCNTRNPGGAISTHCSVCRKRLGSAPATTRLECVTYIGCKTPKCGRWYHKQCVAKLHECFFQDGDGREIDLMDPDTFIFLCPRCVFCHHPECKVAQDAGEPRGAGAYSVKERGPRALDIYYWPAYRSCADCDAIFHLSCAAGESFMCTYCHRTTAYEHPKNPESDAELEAMPAETSAAASSAAAL
jgi:hypothetical protein